MLVNVCRWACVYVSVILCYHSVLFSCYSNQGTKTTRGIFLSFPHTFFLMWCHNTQLPNLFPAKNYSWQYKAMPVFNISLFLVD